jgi:hypothetical protein
MGWRVFLVVLGVITLLGLAYLFAQEKPPEPGPVPQPGPAPVPEPRQIRVLPQIAGAECAMVTEGGKIYLVAGIMVYKVDAEKMELEKKKDLTEAITVTAEDIVKRMDRDQDGKISKSEWQGPEEMFAKLDNNTDGFLTKEEIPAEMVERTANMLKRLAARAGKLVIEVDGPNLYIYRSGTIYKLKKEDLQIVKTLALEESQELRTPERAVRPPTPEGAEKKPPTKEGEK